MTLLLGAFTVGLILSLLALGVYITFRIFEFPDITTEGSITLGGSIAAVMLVHGHVPPLVACLGGLVGGMIAGAATGVLYTKCKINGLLSSILVMTALYSVNLRIMGRSNIPLLDVKTVFTHNWFNGEGVNLFGWDVSGHDLTALISSFVIVGVVSALLYLFFRTHLGTAMRATGDNEQMVKAQGSDVEWNIILGVSISNGLIGLAGALLAQYQGFNDAQMGIGMLVWGLASVIIGEALTGSTSLGLALIGAVMGSILFRLLVAIALRWGLNPNDLKLMTAVFVFAALVLPRVVRSLPWLKRRPVGGEIAK
jgi:putative tryptophan/tyrosine transport system permease protein